MNGLDKKWFVDTCFAGKVKHLIRLRKQKLNTITFDSSNFLLVRDHRFIRSLTSINDVFNITCVCFGWFGVPQGCTLGSHLTETKWFDAKKRKSASADRVNFA